MRKILATAAAAGIMALGLATAPAQASTTASMDKCHALRVLYADFAVADNAAAGGARDGLVSKADLRAAAAGKNAASPQLREAARFVLEYTSTEFGTVWELFPELDSWGQDHPGDGLISPADLRGYMQFFGCW